MNDEYRVTVWIPSVSIRKKEEKEKIIGKLLEHTVLFGREG
tara:strand:+ start:156 stop:278 length:123 start_codon:yes stop_codon:yes gene_type:complete